MKHFLVLALLTALIICIAPALFAVPVRADTVTYPDPYVLDSPSQSMHLDEVWDLTKGDVTLEYTIDMTQIQQPPRPDPSWRPSWWNPAWEPYNYAESTPWYWEHTLWIEVGMRGVGGPDFNPGPWNTYQGKCGGWMVHDPDSYLGEWVIGDDGKLVWTYDNPNKLDMDEKISLAASAGRDEKDYDVLATDPNTVVAPFGSGDNYGIWFDRDGVDQWQATYPGNVNGGNYNTGGIYHIVITYHAIDANGNGDKTDDGLGVMFATINGIPTGFYAPPPDWAFPPDYYPAGLSFKGDMKQMQVFAGVLAVPDAPDYGYVTLSNIVVTGTPGTADPLVADFTYSPDPVYTGDTVQFSDASHGGFPSYTYSWDFNADGTEDSNLKEPTWTFATSGTYKVKLTVTPSRCVPMTIEKTLTVNDKKTTLIVKKNLINNNGRSLKVENFQFTVNTIPTLTQFFEPDGTNELIVDPGTYTVTEPAVAGYTTTYSNCANVAIPIGGTATCTITNDDKPCPTKPCAKLTACPTCGTKPLKVKFTDSSTGISPGGSWKLDFGDGSLPVTKRDPSNVYYHTYLKAGTYYAKLTVMNACGQGTTSTVTITVKCPTMSSASMTLTKVEPYKVRVQVTSTGWDSGTLYWGDGMSDPVSPPNTKYYYHTYANRGTYTIRLTIRNECSTTGVSTTRYVTI